jgi:hypothetical protein
VKRKFERVIYEWIVQGHATRHIRYLLGGQSVDDTSEQASAKMWELFSQKIALRTIVYGVFDVFLFEDAHDRRNSSSES